MLHHCRAVARGAKTALLIGDMPFMSYQVSTEEAVRNAGRFLQEGWHGCSQTGGGTGTLGRRPRHHRSRDSCHGAPGPDTTIGPHAGWIPPPGTHCHQLPSDCSRMPFSLKKQGASAWCSNPSQPGWPKWSRSDCPSPPSELELAQVVTGRCW